jgi:hypothetical protein
MVIKSSKLVFFFHVFDVALLAIFIHYSSKHVARKFHKEYEFLLKLMNFVWIKDYVEILGMLIVGHKNALSFNLQVQL